MSRRPINKRLRKYSRRPGQVSLTDAVRGLKNFTEDRNEMCNFVMDIMSSVPSASIPAMRTVLLCVKNKDLIEEAERTKALPEEIRVYRITGPLVLKGAVPTKKEASKKDFYIVPLWPHNVVIVSVDTSNKFGRELTIKSLELEVHGIIERFIAELQIKRAHA